jgi:hypothetical protein
MKTLHCLVFGVLAAAGLGVARGDVIVGDLDQTTNGADVIPIEYEMIAESFITPGGSPITLSQITLPLSDGTDVVGNFDISLYDNTGVNGTPGSVLADVSGDTPITELSANISNFTVSPNATVTLQPDTTYYVVLSADANITNLSWAWTLSTTYSGSGTLSDYSQFNSGNWNGPNDISFGPYQMEVDGTSVPEPAWAGGLAGVAALGVVGRRKRFNRK